MKKQGIGKRESDWLARNRRQVQRFVARYLCWTEAARIMVRKRKMELAAVLVIWPDSPQAAYYRNATGRELSGTQPAMFPLLIFNRRERKAIGKQWLGRNAGLLGEGDEKSVPLVFLTADGSSATQFKVAQLTARHHTQARVEFAGKVNEVAKDLGDHYHRLANAVSLSIYSEARQYRPANIPEDDADEA